jgi:hypothetical protein
MATFGVVSMTLLAEVIIWTLAAAAIGGYLFLLAAFVYTSATANARLRLREQTISVAASREPEPAPHPLRADPHRVSGWHAGSIASHGAARSR